MIAHHTELPTLATDGIDRLVITVIVGIFVITAAWDWLRSRIG